MYTTASAAVAVLARQDACVVASKSRLACKARFLQVQPPPGKTALHCFAVDPCWGISSTAERILPLVEHTLAQLTQTRRKVDAEPSAVEAITGPPRSDEDVAQQTTPHQQARLSPSNRRPASKRVPRTPLAALLDMHEYAELIGHPHN